MRSNKTNRTFFVIVITATVVITLMLLVYALVQRTTAIKQTELAMKVMEENVRLSQLVEQVSKTANEQALLAAANAEKAYEALRACQQKTK
jgi:hypothetical protein